MIQIEKLYPYVIECKTLGTQLLLHYFFFTYKLSEWPCPKITISLLLSSFSISLFCEKKVILDDAEGFFGWSCEVCDGGFGGRGSTKPSACSRGSDMQSNRAEPMLGSSHVVGAAVRNMLQQAEAAEAMPLWVPERP